MTRRAVIGEVFKGPVNRRLRRLDGIHAISSCRWRGQPSEGKRDRFLRLSGRRPGADAAADDGIRDSAAGDKGNDDDRDGNSAQGLQHAL